jgi:hypothetical protein
VYTRELELDDDTLERLLRASLYLGVAEVQQAICEYLTSRLSVETCLVRSFPNRPYSSTAPPTSPARGAWIEQGICKRCGR